MSATTTTMVDATKPSSVVQCHSQHVPRTGDEGKRQPKPYCGWPEMLRGGEGGGE